MDRRNIIKRSWKPNKGGGRHNQSHGGGNHSRKGDFDFDDFEDGPVLVGPSVGRNSRQPTGQPSRHGRGRGQNARTGSSTSGTECPKPKAKVEMHRLHMTTENQKMVHDMLKSLHNHSDGSDSEYDEIDTRGEEHYWQTKEPAAFKQASGTAGGLSKTSSLLTQEPAIMESTRSTTYSTNRASILVPVADSADINPAALQKLQRCGFSRSLCQEALQVCDGDLGTSLEYLLTELRNLDDVAVLNANSPLAKEGSEIPEDICVLREEEKMALQSIFEHRFVERLVNRVWLLHLELPELKELLNLGGSSAGAAGSVHKQAHGAKEICRFYRKGGCRFGDMCKNLHVTEQSMVKKAEDLQGPLADNLFTLEIRFPAGNMYPRDIPLLAFSSSVGRIQPHCCLNISRFLMKSAAELADAEQPAIYSLVCLLENSEQLHMLLEMSPSSLAEPCAASSHSRTGFLLGGAHAKPSEKRSFTESRDEKASRHYSSRNVSGSSQNNKKDLRTEDSDSLHSDKLRETQTHVKYAQQNMKGNSQVSSHEKQANVLKQNKKLKEDFRMKPSNQSYQKRLADRKGLPVWGHQDEVLAAVEESQVVVISGTTGCGKTTQVPQFILDKHLQIRDLQLCNIVCTQPRRISTIAVAERVAFERVERVGNSVGYQIRLESVQSLTTRLLFCTTGIILRRLEGDPSLSDVTHLIVDEVHERSEESDFLLMVLRDILPKRPDLKVILMSATMNAELFSSYFNCCPIVEIPGKTFPVKSFFLEDAIEMTKFVLDGKSPYARFNPKPPPGGGAKIQKSKKRPSLSYADAIEESLMGLAINDEYDEYDEPSEKWTDEKLNIKQLTARYSEYSKKTVRCLAAMDFEKINFDLIVSLLEWIVAGNHEFPRKAAILVFLPGFAEIQTLMDTLLSSAEFGRRNKAIYKIVPLHSSLSSEEQNSVFMKPEEGVTKIVIATNIAETSITIDDIVYVVDSGRMKEKRYDAARSMESLETVWVSKANALQRKGRAGRVMSGICFHLFTQNRFENFREQPIPEIQRVPLEQLMLRIKMLDMFSSHEARDVLSNVLEPPSEEAMENAIHRLRDVGALDEKETLTALGYHLGSLPVDVRLGKLMIFGSIFRCLDAALTIAAALSFKSPFVSPFDKKTEASEKKKEFAFGNSDYLTIWNAYNKWLDVKKQGKQEERLFCHENFMSQRTLQMLASLKQQYVELLSDIGFTDTGIRLRHIQRVARETGGDGVLDVTGQEANMNTKNWQLISAVLVAALYPNVVQIVAPESRYKQNPQGPDLKFQTKMDGQVHIHPSSVNFQEREFESPYLVYHEKVKTTKVYIRDCTMVSIYSLLLLGGGQISTDLYHGHFVLSMDEGWIRFKASSSQVAQLLQQLRAELDQLLQDKIRDPTMNLSTCPRGSKIIETIVKLLITQ